MPSGGFARSVDVDGRPVVDAPPSIVAKSMITSTDSSGMSRERHLLTDAEPSARMARIACSCHRSASSFGVITPARMGVAKRRATSATGKELAQARVDAISRIESVAHRTRDLLLTGTRAGFERRILRTPAGPGRPDLARLVALVEPP